MAAFRNINRVKRKRSPGYTSATGLKEVINNLNKEITKLEDASIQGLIKAAVHVRRKTETEIPLTPVDLGNLRHSWTVVTSKEGLAAGRSGNFKGPNAQRISASRELAIGEAKTYIGRLKRKGRRVFIVMGYTAYYALFVHEGPAGRKDVQFKKPGADVKWFEKHLDAEREAILEIVRKNAKIE